ncbi:MAG: hypothetical protein AAF714_12485 [Pseudomonadota bacterium]
MPDIETIIPPGAFTIIAHERTKVTLNYLAADQVDALIVQDPGHVVRAAARKQRARCDRRLVIASQDQIRTEILLKEHLSGQHMKRSDDV